MLVASLLDRESKLKRGRFREETLTDVLTGALAAFAGPELVIEYPPEAATGGDLDLDFWHINSGRRVLLRIQAKRLNAETKNNKKVALQCRGYNELLHWVPKNSEYQFRTLVNECGPFVPLYMFYNHGHVVRGLRPTPGPAVRGINLAFATDVAAEMDQKLAAAPGKRLHHKRLSHLRRHFFGLEAILCAPPEPGSGVPSPYSVAQSLGRVWNAVVADDPQRSYADEVLRKLSELDSIDWGDGGRRLPDGSAIRINQALQRPMITFMSGRTDDERTPIISSDPDIPLE